jgi:uncharacterized protein YbaP (TraB family)
MKIWAAMITIEAIDLAKAGNPEVLDQVLVRLAQDAGKQCDALETVAEQVAVFDSFSTAEQTSLLKTSLDTLQRMQRAGESPAEELLSIYLAGDAQALFDAATKCDTPGADANLQARFVQAVLTERNERMAERIVERLRQHPDQVAFFAIGAAHCAGERGVLTLLEKAGYAATRIGDQASSSAAAAAAGALAPR